MSIEKENKEKRNVRLWESFKDSKIVFGFILAWKLRQFFFRRKM